MIQQSHCWAYTLRKPEGKRDTCTPVFIAALFIIARTYYFMANRWGNNGKSERLFWGAAKSLQMVTAAMKFKDTCFLEEKL